MNIRLARKHPQCLHRLVDADCEDELLGGAIKSPPVRICCILSGDCIS